jgi:hypothetical protein
MPSGPQRVSNPVAVAFPSSNRNLRFAGCNSHPLHNDNVFTGIGELPYIES